MKAPIFAAALVAPLALVALAGWVTGPMTPERRAAPLELSAQMRASASQPVYCGPMQTTTTCSRMGMFLTCHSF